jgi:integrase
MSTVTVSVLPKYRHHKGTGQAFAQIKGRRHYLGKWNTQASKERYAAFVAELAVSPDVVVAQKAANSRLPAITVVELAAAYLDFAQGYYRKNGQITRSLDNIKRAIRLVKDLYGREPVAEFSPLRLLALQQNLATAGCTRSYVNKQVGAIKRMFKWGVSRELVPAQVHTALATVEGLRMGRTTAKEPKRVLPVEDEVVNATLPHLPVVVSDMVRFQQLTGARPGEVSQLRPVDVDRSREVWQYQPESHKTEHHGRKRIIYIGPQAQQVLLPYLLRDAQANCFQPVESEQKRREEQRVRRKTRVQPSQWNRRKARPKRMPKTCYTKDSYHRAVERACEVAFGMSKELRNVSKKLPEEERRRLLMLAAEWRHQHC